MASDHQYIYFRVSKSEDLTTSAQQYKELRLRALQLSPSSFGSTYEIESTFPDEYWMSRITGDGRETFICAAIPSPESNAADPSSLEWVAQVTLLGPRSREQFTLPEVSRQPFPGPDEEEERWQMLGLYTLTSHRGKGIATKLCQEALNYIRSYRSEPENVRFRLMVKAGAHAPLGFYEQLGFTEVANCTLTEAMIANGDGSFLPEDHQEQEKYLARTSHVMMQLFKR
ncbi:GNAT family N-acetyltransferase [Aspergillus glaucus CBS 516.65]|uniref:N-acetyltransferase domain-containing protein n=1 Tax=Aspergillus glaucus CBS 516.65 TaxID=1160497 RepID=A0A1L9VCB7_ASPGL|nr:hypothetical protein ASPGLDRAFT_27937 [Aspergillus glaucus CBS 516.65]OJJ81560.1 hypothetical protein ASPGLDRAFT_27937 [Aspergillus glaucus CBS 516.65]